MNLFNVKSVVLSVALGFSAMSANATIATVFGEPTAGLNNFNATVIAAGGTPVHDNLTGLQAGTSIVRTDYTITRNNGGSIFPTNYGTLSGQVIDISPAGATRGIGAIGSGVSLNFNTPINSIGFEVGDWGTCCQPSKLFISFDGGAAIEVGVSNVVGDVDFNGKSEVFVGAFDDTNEFSKVQFWGDGFGEFLVFGGTINYALLDQGSLPPIDVPEPATAALLGLGLFGFAASRRKAAKSKNA